MAVDKGTKGLALRQLADPVNASWAGKGLGQPKNGEKKSEYGDRSHEQAKTFRRIYKNQCRCEVNQQSHDLYNNEARSVWIEGQTPHERKCDPCYRLWSSERQELNQTQCEQTQ